MSAVIDADRERVWQALTRPSELVAWNEKILSAIDETVEYPREGQPVRWLYRLGSVQVVLHEQPLEIVRHERLRTALVVGSLRFEQTFALANESNESPRTRLSMKLVTTNSVPVVGGVFDRFSLRKLAAESIDRSLLSIQNWCHEHP
jgi:uncharacterized protein YndB with AHSA1/START domain